MNSGRCSSRRVAAKRVPSWYWQVGFGRGVERFVGFGVPLGCGVVFAPWVLRFGCTQFSNAILATLPVTASGHPGNVG